MLKVRLKLLHKFVATNLSVGAKTVQEAKKYAITHYAPDAILVLGTTKIDKVFPDFSDWRERTGLTLG